MVAVDSKQANSPDLEMRTPPESLYGMFQRGAFGNAANAGNLQD